MTKAEIIKGLARHHGRTIFWFHSCTGEVIRAIVLMTYKEGVSIKPFDIKDAIKAHKKAKTGKSEKEIRAPKYCFASCGRNAKNIFGREMRTPRSKYHKSLQEWISGLDRYENVYGFDEHITKEYGGFASCGHV